MFAHEIAHIANEDLCHGAGGFRQSPHEPTGPGGTDRDPVQFARAAGWRGGGSLAWLLLLAASPQLALLAQLGLSRVREFDATASRRN